MFFSFGIGDERTFRSSWIDWDGHVPIYGDFFSIVAGKGFVGGSCCIYIIYIFTEKVSATVSR